MSLCKSGTGPDKLYLNWVIRVDSTNLKETALLKKKIDTIYGGHLNPLLINVSHMTSCTLQNLFIEV